MAARLPAARVRAVQGPAAPPGQAGRRRANEAYGLLQRVMVRAWSRGRTAARPTRPLVALCSDPSPLTYGKARDDGRSEVSKAHETIAPSLEERPGAPMSDERLAISD